MKKILVIDDDEIFLDMIACVLREAGYEVIALQDSLNISTVMHNDDFALIITDIIMPDFDGLDIIGSIKEFSSVPIIAVSGRQESLEQAIAMGVSRALDKPVNSEQLLAAVKELLS